MYMCVAQLDVLSILWLYFDMFIYRVSMHEPLQYNTIEYVNQVASVKGRICAC